MAARRLLIIMLILLGISSVLAIALPSPNRDGSTPHPSGSTGATGATSGGATGAGGVTGPGADQPGGDGGTVVAQESVALDAKKPVTIKAETGTRMILTVSSKGGSEVEIEGLGLTGFADPYAPAVFDVILPSKSGRYAVGAPDATEPAATIVTEPGPASRGGSDSRQG